MSKGRIWIEPPARRLVKCSMETLPESVNRIWRNKSGGGVYKSPKAKAWQDEMVLRMRTARKNAEPYEYGVVLVLKIERRGWRRFDLDNRIKTVQDCLAPAGIIEDDSQVVEVHCYKQLGAEKDLCCVEVWKS